MQKMKVQIGSAIVQVGYSTRGRYKSTYGREQVFSPMPIVIIAVLQSFSA